MLQCRKRWVLTLLVGLLGLIPGRANAEGGALEKFNRVMDDFNQRVTIFSSENSTGQFLSETIPEDVRRGMYNFFANLGQPVVALSSLAQGDTGNAEVATKRFFYNLYYGYGGVIDRASEAGVKSQPRNLGQAFCSAGLPDGPFLVIPFYGPATLGDFLGSSLPILAGYVVLGEMFWIYRASSAVATKLGDASYDKKIYDEKESGEPITPIDTPEATPDEIKAAESAQRKRVYQLNKEKYLAEREAVCHHRLTSSLTSTDDLMGGEQENNKPVDWVSMGH